MFTYTNNNIFVQDASVSFGKYKQYHNIPANGNLNQRQPFSLILPATNTATTVRQGTVIEPVINKPPSYQIIDSGMILMKNHISLRDQVYVVLHPLYIYLILYNG